MKRSNMFMVCKKTGRITGINKEFAWIKLFFPIIGLAALFWYLIRVLPKPARALYPCQQIGAPIGFGFLAYVLTWTGFIVFFRKAKNLLVKSKYVLAILSICLALAFMVGNMGLIPNPLYAFTPQDPPNSPMGTGKGIFPGRVAWAHNTDATTYNGSGSWWDDNGTNQNACNAMLSQALKALTGESTDSSAWDALFKYYNSNHGIGNVGYQQGEKIAMKINCNNVSSHTDTDANIDASPHSISAMLGQLVNSAGVPQNMITVYDASRPIPNRIYNKCHADFPNVLWADSLGSNGRQAITWQKAITYSVSNDCGPNIPSLLIEAKYLINMSLLKGHALAGMTLTAKNHYGSISAREHSYIMASNRPYGTYSPFVDFIGHKHMGQKTVLFMIDGLYGTRAVATNISDASQAKWNNLFNGDYSSSYFLSQDPVAIDSVGLDFLNSEFGTVEATMNRSDNYMHEAAQANNPPSGTTYAPNGDYVRLLSLGVHEHWNNSQDKKYTRNLGTGNGIELVTESGPPPAGSIGDVNNDGSINIIDALLISQYYVGLNPAGFDTNNADTNCNGTIDVIDALLVAQYYVGLINSFC